MAFSGLAIAAAITIAHLGHAWSFFYDEWGVILYRRSGGLAAFAAPLNGHLVAVPVAVYRFLFATVGLSSYTPYRWVTIVAHVGLIALVYAYGRARLPQPVALIAATLLLFLGYAWEVLFWMMNLGFIIPLIAFVGILLLSDGGPRRRAGIAGESLLLTIALASSGLGVAVAAGVLFEKMLRRRWRELPWLGLPAAGYAAWFAFYRPTAVTPVLLRRLPGASANGDVGSLGFSLSNLDRMPHYVLRLAESAASGLVGANGHWFWLLPVGGAILIGIVVGRRITLRFASIAVALGVFWLLTSLVRGQVGQPNSSRYIYPGSVFLVLLLIEAWSGLPWGRMGGVRVRRTALALLSCAVLVAVGSSVRHLQRIGEGAAQLFARTNVELAKLSCDRTRIPPDYQPDAIFMPWVRAGLYQAAIRDLGSPVPRRILDSACRGQS